MAFYHTMCFVFTVLILCNLVLYPSIFSSVFRKVFGSGSADAEKEKLPDVPPQMRNAQKNPGSNRRMEMERAAQRNMKHADPASYFAQQKQESSKGRGLLGSVLPVYAVGIVVYFAYIMYRIFLKEKPKPNEPGSNMWDTSKEGLTLQQRVQQEQLQKQLSEQLKAENYTGIKSTKKTTKGSKSRKQQPARNDSDSSKESANEMAALKKRLEDTERSMHRMMEMMNSMGIAMSQVTEQLTGSVPTDLADSLGGAMQQAGEDASDEGQRSSEEDFSPGSEEEEEDLASEQEDDGGLVKEASLEDDEEEEEAYSTTDDEDRGGVEVIGGVDTEYSDTVRRRLVPAVGPES